MESAGATFDAELCFFAKHGASGERLEDVGYTEGERKSEFNEDGESEECAC